MVTAVVVVMEEEEKEEEDEEEEMNLEAGDKPTIAEIWVMKYSLLERKTASINSAKKGGRSGEGGGGGESSSLNLQFSPGSLPLSSTPFP